MKNNPQSVAQIKAAMDKWAAALSAKDLEAMHQDYADDFRIFDIGTTKNSADGLKELWAQCLPYFDTPKISYKNMHIEASDDMAVVYFNSFLNGMKMELPEEMKDAWLRGTICFRKIDGTWKSIHEHFSFPVNVETNEIIFDQDS